MAAGIDNSYEDDFETSTAEQKFPLPNRSRSRTNLSLFDLVLEVVPSEKSKKTEYEEQLHREVCEWQDIMQQKFADAAKVETASVTIDKTVLTPEQLAYIQRCANLTEFAEESQAFCRKAVVYLGEHSELVEMQDQLMDHCKYHLDGMAFDVIYDCLYDKTKIKFA